MTSDHSYSDHYITRHVTAGKCGTTGITLDERHRSIIREAAEAFPEIRKVILFGSRALETADRGSDVDLAILGEDVTRGTRLRLHDRLNQQSRLPFFVDVVDYRSLENEQLKEHIDRHGVVIYESTA